MTDRASVRAPIFFIGAPRSGTTVIFNAFAARPDLAWFSQHLSRLPGWPAVTVLARLATRDMRLRKSIDRSDLQRRWLEKLRVGPSEAYRVWERYCGRRFLYDFLLDVEASEDEARRLRRLVAKVQRYEGKSRFATKITGPARIGYLSSIFPDAVFVHVVRDGRAVVNSLLDVHFWGGTWREREPAWAGGLSEEELARWRELGETPLALAALEWRAVVRRGREEAAALAPDRYAEVRYEDFVADAHGVLCDLARFCDLAPAREPHDFLTTRIRLRDMNYRWAERFDGAELQLLDELIGDLLDELGYDGAFERASGRERVSRPFAGHDGSAG